MATRRDIFLYVVGVITGFAFMRFMSNYSYSYGFDVRTHGSFLSHAALDSLPAMREVVHFQDAHLHQDDDTVAKKLYDEVRVLCWVMTSAENLEKKARHVRATWARRCNKLLFVSDNLDAAFPTIDITIDKGRDHLTAKTMTAFDYVYRHHYNDSDWFMKVDDDTYVIVENLRYFLSSKNSSDPIFFGHRFKPYVTQGYYSGGGGYVFSREALRRFGGRKDGDCIKDGGAEDVEIGKCMEKLGVKTADTRDALGRSRFHCFDPPTHLNGGYPPWYFQYDAYGAKKGMNSISDYAITFHYISPEKMYELEFYIYHMTPYGIAIGRQNLNDAPPNVTTARPTTIPSSLSVRPTTPTAPPVTSKGVRSTKPSVAQPTTTLSAKNVTVKSENPGS